MATRLEAESLQTAAARQRRLSWFVIPIVALVIGAGLGYVLASKGADAPSSESVGPTRVESGVPVGYSQTREGAVAAAEGFAETLSGPLLVEPERYRSANELLAAPEWKEQASRGAEQDIQSFETRFGLVSKKQRGEEVSVTSRAIKSRTQSWTKSKAVVDVWLLTLVDAADGSIHEIWTAGTYTLVWRASDWRVADTERLDALEPVPSGTGSSGINPLREFGEE